MNKKQEQQILDYYSTSDKYIRSKTHSHAHQTVFTKESDKYQWFVLEQKSQCEIGVRQTNNHGTIIARDNYELTRNTPKCVGMEHLCEGASIGQDEISKTHSFPKSYVSYRNPRAVSAKQQERAKQIMIAKNKAKEF